MNEVIEHSVPVYTDERGFLWQIYGQYEFPQVKRIYVVGNFNKDTIRGFHGHTQETKGYFVASGSAKFISYPFDDKHAYTTHVLCTKCPKILKILPGMMHGWKALEDNTLLIGLSDKSLSESEGDDLRESPYVLGEVPWQIKAR